MVQSVAPVVSIRVSALSSPYCLSCESIPVLLYLIIVLYRPDETLPAPLKLRPYGAIQIRLLVLLLLPDETPPSRSLKFAAGDRTTINRRRSALVDQMTSRVRSAQIARHYDRTSTIYYRHAGPIMTARYGTRPGAVPAILNVKVDLRTRKFNLK